MTEEASVYCAVRPGSLKLNGLRFVLKWINLQHVMLRYSGKRCCNTVCFTLCVRCVSPLTGQRERESAAGKQSQCYPGQDQCCSNKITNTRLLDTLYLFVRDMWQWKGTMSSTRIRTNDLPFNCHRCIYATHPCNNRLLRGGEGRKVWSWKR